MFRKFFDRPPRRRTSDQIGAPTTCILPGFLFAGELTGRGHYLIQGDIAGEGRIVGVATLAVGSHWKGNLAADVLILAGKVEGNLVAEEKIDLAPTAHVVGDLTAPVVTIAEGAVLEGNILRPRKTQVMHYSERRQQGEPPDSESV